ncbi:hypothetical protein M0R45_020747 [Rubus argutus]|uniref:F-box domain-containing protein n=1 Tax=Rubus argutus TaxID=59490 RepID=A0AAW1XBJ1_RUBAR
MPREKNGNPMNPRKKVGAKRQRGKWKPRGCLNVPQLPEALVMDILLRLSIKDLGNCRCVCKDWLHMISDPQFAHLHRLASPICILIGTSPPVKQQRKLDLIHTEKCAGSRMRIARMRFAPQNCLPCPVSKMNLINSCNGLLCLTGSRDGSLYVCNPILGQYITIPSPDNQRMYFANFVALGFNAGTNEYKVVQTSCRDYRCSDPEAKIYTIGTGVWRSIGKPPRGCGAIPFNSVLHGALHWIPFYFNCPQVIESFDFEREEFRQLLPPASLQEFKHYDGLRLGVLKGCLFLCVFGGDDRKADMWVMKDYGVQESWTKFLVIENLYPRDNRPHVNNVYEPIMFLNDVEILLTYKRRFVVRYNQETKRLENTTIIRTQSQFQAVGYCPCFVSLHDVSNGEEVKRYALK